MAARKHAAAGLLDALGRGVGSRTVEEVQLSYELSMLGADLRAWAAACADNAVPLEQVYRAIGIATEMMNQMSEYGEVAVKSYVTKRALFRDWLAKETDLVRGHVRDHPRDAGE